MAVVLFFLLSSALSLFAQSIELPPPPPKDGNPKLESALWDVASAGKGLRKPVVLPGGLRTTKDGKLVVFLVPEIGKETSSIDTQAVSSLHGEVLAVSKHFVRAAIPLERLDDAANIQGVRFIQRPIRAQTQQTVSEGASEINALANQARGVKGQGVKVAIIDGGFKDADRLSDDMPSKWRSIDFTDTGMYYGDEVHGAACAEIVHDVAPDAELYLVKIEDLLDLENGKDWCISQGVNIISCSLYWLGTGFGDGLGAACDIVNDATNKSILWVNSGGNFAQRQYTAFWADSDADGWHDNRLAPSGPDEVLNLVQADVGETISLWLTWNDWPKTSQDYDLYLAQINDDGRVENIASSISVQNNSDPVEHIEYEVKIPGRYGVEVRKAGTARSELIKVWSTNHDFDTTNVILSTSIAGNVGTPADAAGALSVGAIRYSNWTRGTIEPYSSLGPTVDGRKKPDLVAPTGVSTVSYGTGSFFGTSAAAPHVAGAAALVKSSNPSYTRSQLADALVAATKDLGETGKDNVYGAGKLELPLLQSPPVVIAPVAAFTPSLTSGSAPLTVSFTNQSVGSSVSFLWEFGDGTTGADTNPVHTYTKAGNFTVQLTATNTGGSSKATWTITVTGALPVAAFTPSVSSGSAPLTVSFTNQSTGSPSSYGWDFGDGNTSTEANPRHTYTKAGTYTVHLIATNTGGSNQVTWTITVTVSPPVAAFTPSVISGVAPLMVSFTNQSTGSPTSYSWDFGDGATSTLTGPSHTYTRAGTYTVKLTATREGVSSQASRAISVTTSPAVAAFTPSVTTGGAPLRVSFTNNSTGSPTSYRWDFGDGGTSTATNPTHSYVNAGRYTVRLTATNAGGSNQASRIIIVVPVSVLPAELVMTDTQVGGTTQKTFNITNGSSSSVTITLSVRGISATQYSISPETAVLRAGKSRGFTVTFSPTSIGTKTASVSIGYGSSGTPLSVSLRGQATAPVVTPLTILPTELSMADTRVDSTSQKTFTITNTSSKSVTVTLSVGGLDASQFRVTPGTATLGAGRSRSFTVSFSPASAGAKTASVSISHNAGGSALSVALRGQGIQSSGVTQTVTGALTANSHKFNNSNNLYNEHWVFLREKQVLYLRMHSTTTFYFSGVWDLQRNVYLRTGTTTGRATQSDTVAILQDGQYSIDVYGLNGATGTYTFTATAIPGPLNIGPASKPISTAVNVKEVAVPDHTQLSPNYPNPFNASTTIRYVLPEASGVRLEIYDLMGQLVRVLVEGWQQAGDHQVAWDGRDEQGWSASSGVYLYRLTGGERGEQIRRMLLLR